MASPWTRANLRGVLLSPRFAGWATHKGIVVGTAVWLEIVNRDTWETARAILTDPARQVHVATATLQAKIANAARVLTAATKFRSLSVANGVGDLREAWQGFDLDTQRAVLRRRLVNGVPTTHFKAHAGSAPGVDRSPESARFAAQVAWPGPAMSGNLWVRIKTPSPTSGLVRFSAGGSQVI